VNVFEDGFPAVAAAGLTALDWGVVAAYLALTTILGARLAGKQSTIRDFFLGGRKLPWYAVSGSIVATELSAVTFVAVPFVVFKPGGDITYLQLGIFGALFARLIVAFVLVPAYYEREIYSPYEYMGQRLGLGVRRMTSALFSVGGILAQSPRVYLTAIVLELILGESVLGPLEQATGIPSLAWAVASIGIVAVGWTLMGGIATVIWTDVILFCVFVIGAIVALLTIADRLDGGFGEMLRAGYDAGKLRFIDASADPVKAYTIWTAVIANTWFSTGIYGTDQMMAQRMFCCPNEREAKLAVVSSYVGQFITVLVGLVGVGLFAFYQAHPLSGAALDLYEEKGDRIFPLFILAEIPSGLSGLIVAGIFAAAISSLDSILAALSQTTLSTLYLPWRQKRLAAAGTRVDPEREQRREVRVGRLLVVVFGIVLCVMAVLMEAAHAHYESLLDLALAMATYTSGALLAGFLLAFLRLNIDGSGFLWSAPLSILVVFACVWRQSWAQVTVASGVALLLAAWCAHHLLAPGRQRGVRSIVSRSLILLAGCALPILAQHFLVFDRGGEDVSLAWPWYAPIGCTVAFVFGWILSHRATRKP